MMSLLLSLALSATSMGTTVAEPVAATATSKPAKPAKPKKVCEKIEITGSTVPKRVCRTVVEPAKPAPEATRADNAPQPGGVTN
jgi:hypothetical protein